MKCKPEKKQKFVGGSMDIFNLLEDLLCLNVETTLCLKKWAATGCHIDLNAIL
jgi:hypothetical protein